ncbi:MAG: DUF167 domain-containing protein [Verrucomicrobiae bacterium]|nr:DUF167 domain-containing protein [Verrucomicrobiae bacterium]
MPRLTVKVTPNAKQTEILGPVEIADGETALAIKLKAPPVDGKANTALISFLAKTLGVPKSQVTLVRGKSNRIKQLDIEGVTDEQLAALS